MAEKLRGTGLIGKIGRIKSPQALGAVVAADFAVNYAASAAYDKRHPTDPPKNKGRAQNKHP